MSDLISRQAAIDVLEERLRANGYSNVALVSELNRSIGYLMRLPSAQTEITRCNECIYGHLYIDVQNGVTDSWIECRNPDGLFRDTAADEYCSVSTARQREDVKE